MRKTLMSVLFGAVVAGVVFGETVPSLEGVSIAAARQPPQYVTLCSFNVYKLGSVAPKYLALDDDDGDGAGTPIPTGIPDRIRNLARVLGPRSFDLIVLQEVTDGTRGLAAVADLAAALQADHGITYEYFLSDYIGQGLMAEAIAFLYRPTVLQPELLPGTPHLVANIEIPGRDLVRTQWEAGEFDFTLVAGHLAWGNEEDRDAGYDKVAEIFATATPSQFSDDPDIVVLGDFNRFGKGYESVKRLTYNAAQFLAPNVTFFDLGFNVIKQVTTTSIQGKGVPNDNRQFVSTTVAQNRSVYDMILISRDVDEEFPPGASEAAYVTDFGIVHFDEVGGVGHQPGAEMLAHNDLKEAYSDHRPLWMRFQTNAGHADDPPGGVNLTPIAPPPDDEDIAAPALGVTDQPVQGGPAVLGTGDPPIDVLRGRRPTPGRDIPPQLRDLVLGLLVDGRDASVDRGAHSSGHQSTPASLNEW